LLTGTFAELANAAELLTALVHWLMIVLFVGAVFHVDAPSVIIIIFIGCLLALAMSLVQLIRDINLSLRALALELEQAAKP